MADSIPLRYAQSLRLEGKSAQSLLQLNKALMADLSGRERVLGEWALPYAAKSWIMGACPAGEFLGNPVRHYQHLATRMSGPRQELRTWRAGGCFHLSEAVLGRADFPRDERQIDEEGLRIPGFEEVLEHLEDLGIVGEADLVRTVREGSR